MKLELTPGQDAIFIDRYKGGVIVRTNADIDMDIPKDFWRERRDTPEVDKGLYIDSALIIMDGDEYRP